MVKSLWQDEFLRTAVLPSCVWSTEWGVTNGELNLMVHQRSCDVPLGLPFNVTQYATLLKMIAQVTNLKPGTIDYSIKDAHIYVNQIDMIKEQIRRGKRYKQMSKMTREEVEQLLNIVREKKSKIEDKKSKEYELLDTEERIADLVLNPSKPELVLDPSITDFYDFDNSKDIKHVLVKDYKHMGKISIPVSQ
jgi:thymidylate synthase